MVGYAIAVPGLIDMQSVVLKRRGLCQHEEVHEIGLDYDKDGNAVRLVRCQSCGLLMRECLPMVRA
jgi:hypothetical protein